MEEQDARLVFHETTPPNSEIPLQGLRAGLTPLPLFFNRNNFPLPPEIEPEAYKLKLDGLVARPLEIGLAELKSLPSQKLVSVLECTGNSRSRFGAKGPEAEGVPWGEGAIANAEWQGVPCRLLFEKAGVLPEALQAECQGAGLVRGVEVTKLLQDSLLAYQMNGEAIPHLHGGPVRLVVPGWGGINWVKWISGMTFLDHESPSSFNQDSYVLWDEEGKARGKARVMPLKSVLTQPAEGESLKAGEIEIAGLAWSPGIALAKVEISLDGGKSWQEASFEGEDQGPYAWRAFRTILHLELGSHQLTCRATDTQGNAQPPEVAWNRKGYLMNAWHRVQVNAVIGHAGEG